MTVIADVNAVAVTIATYVPVPLFAIGVFGNIFNIIIFTRQSLIKNSCTIYLLGSSIASLGALFIIFIQQAMVNLFHYDLLVKNIAACRTTYGLLYPCLILSNWFVVLASIDRFCVTSQNAKLRLFNKVIIARRLSIITACIAMIMYIHVFFLFDIQQTSAGVSCRPRTATYQIFYDFFYFAMYSFTPPVILTIIGLATFYQVRQVRRRVAVIPVITSSSFNQIPTNLMQLQRKDRQLITMLFIQLVAAVVLTLPHAIQKLSAVFVLNSNPSPWQVASLNLFLQISRQLMTLNCGISFYL